MRGLGPRCVIVKDSYKFMLVHNLEELADRVQAYIDLEQSKG